MHSKSSTSSTPKTEIRKTNESKSIIGLPIIQKEINEHADSEITPIQGNKTLDTIFEKNETIGTASQVEGAQPRYERTTINGDR